MIITADGYKIIGINKRYYPMQASVNGKPMAYPEVDLTDDPPVTLVVLVAGEMGDYAAYAGHGTPEWVAAHGDKLRFEEACCHFPGGQLKKELYRI
jgi:hypothetical protein